MKITIDNKQIEVLPGDKNIIDVAGKAKIGIPSPCYRSKDNKGCCKVCVVEIEGKLASACCTKPVDGMNVIVNRDDLKLLRKERMLDYQEYLKNPTGDNTCDCSCDCNTSTSESSCCC
jgi:NADH dehydrogenase/NADH:ubiquinone oxidoreductase subunit G